MVEIINFDPAAIAIKSDTLASNYTSNNQWLFNGVPISNERELHANQTGTYVLIADTLGCRSYDTIKFVCTSGPCVELSDVTSIDIFPNPVIDFLKFPPVDQPMEVDIIESSGRLCKDFSQIQVSPSDGLIINVKTLTAGIYFAVIRSGNRKRIIKFIKVE
jgi:hypothetical protein